MEKMTMSDLQKVDKQPKPVPGDGTFKLTLPIQMSYEKDVDGRSVKFIGGIASGTDLDYDGERMAKSAIEAFVKAIDEGYYLPNGKFTMIPLRSGHRKEWDDILGWVSKAEIDSHNNLWIEAELADTSSADDLYKALTTPQRHGRPTELGFSVGGTIRKAGRVWDENTKKSVREIQDVALREISVVGSPAFPTAYVEALYKSVDWDAIPLPNEEGSQERDMIAPVEKNDDVQDAAKEGPLTDEQAVALNEEQAPAAEAQEEKDLAEQGATTTETQESTTQESANVGNASADSNESAKSTAEVSKTDSQTDTEKAVYWTEEARDLRELVGKMEEQLSEIRRMMGGDKSKVEETDTAAVEKTETVVETETVTTKSESIDPVVKAVQAALEAFKTEHLNPLVADMQAVKSTVEEMGGEAVDKSLAVRTAKEGEGDAIEKFRSRMKTNKTSNPISEAVRASLGG
jgi:HK97 family phage prohead protease